MDLPSHLKLLTATLLVAFVVASAQPVSAQKFYPDDPIWKEPPPGDTPDPTPKSLSAILEYFTNQFTSPGERHPDNGVIPAGNANTVGGVPDSPWFTNRHGRVRMSLVELTTGPGATDPPRTDRPWTVLVVKQYGDRPGMLVRDADNTVYQLRFAPEGYGELWTGAEMVSSRIYYAAGYNTMQNHLVYFHRDRLVVAKGGEKVTSFGNMRDLTDEDVDAFLEHVVPDSERGYRAVATRAPHQEILGNYQFYGTRTDDPNDVVPHEHRRDLRGIWVFNAWLANDRFNPANTVEAVVRNGNTQYIERFLIDFFQTLGAGDQGVKAAREGNEYRFNLASALKNAAGMGVWMPGWTRARYPGLRSVGRFESDKFDADAWVPATNYATWTNRLPDDIYWATKIVMSFTDDDIRAIVNTGGYTDPRATRWIADTLIKRRDKIGRAFLAKVLPLDNFRVTDRRLGFDDLKQVFGFGRSRQFSVQWYEFDNMTEGIAEISADPDAGDHRLPSITAQAEDGAYFLAVLWADDPEMNVHVYLRKSDTGFDVVGIERNWPGTEIMQPVPAVVAPAAFDRFAWLEDNRKRLLEAPTRNYNEVTGRNLTAEKWFKQLTVSERTTYDAVSHALMRSPLTNDEGNDLGSVLDLIMRVEQIAGQYSDRGGDQQFRLYVELEPEAEDFLQRSVQFEPGEENTIYHVGYPRSYRQQGNVPNLQISLSEDGARADIDIDYRSSKSPQALFNGHLTAANSDVRAGSNIDRHNGRWFGLINWWQDIYGKLGERKTTGADLLSRKLGEPATPLPPDRPVGAAPEELHEAAQEFLTDWLVRGEIDEAIQFTSSRVIACINIDDDNEVEVLDGDATAGVLREIMDYALEQLGDRDSLTAAIDEVPPWAKDQLDRRMSHRFERDFTIVPVRNQAAAAFMCSTRRGTDPPPTAGEPDAVGTYYSVLFRFKTPEDQGGSIAFLWDRQEGAWKIVSFDIIEQ